MPCPPGQPPRARRSVRGRCHGRRSRRRGRRYRREHRQRRHQAATHLPFVGSTTSTYSTRSTVGPLAFGGCRDSHRPGRAYARTRDQHLRRKCRTSPRQTGSINLGQGFPDTDGPAEVAEVARACIADGRGNQYLLRPEFWIFVRPLPSTRHASTGCQWTLIPASS